MSTRNLLVTVSFILCGYLAFTLFNSSVPEEPDADQEYVRYFNEHYKIFSLDIPDKLSFAGEEMPLHLVDVKERIDRELMVNTYWQSQSLLMFKRAHRWLPVIEPILADEGVPDDFKYLSIAESGLSNVVSPAGATGFWQFLKGTAKEYELEVREGIDERYNVEKSTRAACRYLKEAHEHFGSWTMAAAAYNYGKANVNKQIARQKADNYYDLLLNEETRRYVFRIVALKEILTHPAKYGFHFRPADLYAPYETIELEVDSSVSDLADFAHGYGINYKTLKTLNPWLRETELINPQSTSYTIKLPADGTIGMGAADKH